MVNRRYEKKKEVWNLKMEPVHPFLSISFLSNSYIMPVRRWMAMTA